MFKSVCCRCLLLLSVWLGQAHAMIDLELTQGVAASIPLAITKFEGGDLQVPGDQTLTEVISNDLQNSGEFRVVNQGEAAAGSPLPQRPHRGADYVLSGSIQRLGGGQYQVHFTLQSLVDKKAEPSTVLQGDFSAAAASMRRLAHRISDEIYTKLVGVQGVFSTKIAYILVKQLSGSRARYQLEVADQDGFNPQTLLSSQQPIMSPAWSPDGTQLAYVSFEQQHAAIYRQNLSSGARTLLSNAPGINGAPAFSPDGKKLALVLSKTGNPKIYLLDLATHELQQLTEGWSIDTEPSFSADGSLILFTSNRDGSPQIYQYALPTHTVQRVSFDGHYNARASFLPNGQSIVLMHRENGQFGIGRLDLESGQVQSLVQSGNDESPSVAPNGKMIIYATQYAGRGVLAQVSIDGRIKLRLPAQEGAVQEPAWSPFFKS